MPSPTLLSIPGALAPAPVPRVRTGEPGRLMSRRPRVLMIAPSMPARTGSGYAIRFGIFLEALARVAEVDLVVPVVLDDAGIVGSLPGSLGVLTSSFPTHPLHDTPYRLLTLIDDPGKRAAALRLFGRPSAAAGITAKVLEHMRALGQARNYDLIHVERIYLAEAGLAAATPDTRLSLDLDEDDYESMCSQAVLTSRRDPSSEPWNMADADLTDQLVRSAASRFDVHWISSEQDELTLRQRHPWLRAELLPNAVEFPAEPKHRDDGKTLLFVGSLGYVPNVEGLLWFARSVWPRVRARAAPGIRLVVAGPNTPDEIRALERLSVIDRLLGRKSPVRVLGRVPELRPLYEQATVAIAPLFGGRGTRLKLLEAAAEAVPIVATPDAARGLPITPPWAWIAEDADSFGDACLAALAVGPERAARVAQGRALVASEHDRAHIIAGLAERFASVLATARHELRTPCHSA